MEIVILDAKTVTNGDIDLSVLGRFGNVRQYELTDAEQIVERIKDADIVLTNKCKLTADVLKQTPRVKYIGLFATGYNNIDVEYAGENGITVCNAGGYSTDAVAQHTFAMILDHANKVSQYSAFVHDGGWKKSETFSPFIFPMNELAGKTIGIIGYGNIGRAVARIAKAFSMNVIAYVRNMKSENEFEVSFTTDIDDLLSASDFISVHCPLNADSEKMFNAERFAKCKKGAYFINTARGPIVDEDALYNALESGILSGAAIDVLETEPMKEQCRLDKAPNCTITPHIAWAPLETRERLLGIVCDNIEKWIEGNPQNTVQKKPM